MSEIRVAAFGGIGFGPRVHTGAWPDLGHFTDLKAVAEGGAVSYGVALDGERACLAFRQLQSVGERGGYAYTLLIDPGDDAWRRVNWNAAAAAARALASPELSQLLLIEPERAATRALSAKIVDELFQPWGAQPSTDEPKVRLVLDAIVDAVCSGETVVAPVDECKPEILAAALESVPVALRVGAGWLVRGAPSSLAPLLVGAFAAEGLAGRGPTPGIAEALSDIMGRRAAPGERDCPAHRWGTAFAPAAAQMLALERAQDVSSFDVSVFDDVVRVIANGGRFDDALRRAIAAWSGAHGSERWTEWTTQVLPAALSAERLVVGSRLEARPVAAFLAERQLTLASSHAEAIRPAVSGVEVWQHQVSEASSAPQVVTLVELALRDGGLSPVEAGRIVAEAVERTWSFEGSLLAWHGSSAASARAVVEAARAGVNGTVGAIDDYLVLGHDPGAEWLVSNRPVSLGPAVDRALERTADSADRLVEAWLDSLAQSPARGALSFETKVRVGRCRRAAAWRHFAEFFDAAARPTDVPKTEVPYLIDEVQARLEIGAPSMLPLPLPSTLLRLGTDAKALVEPLCALAAVSAIETIVATAADLATLRGRRLGASAEAFVERAVQGLLAGPEPGAAWASVRRLVIQQSAIGRQALPAAARVVDGWRVSPPAPGIAEELLLRHVALLSDLILATRLDLLSALDAVDHFGLVALCAAALQDDEFAEQPRVRQFPPLFEELRTYMRKHPSVGLEAERLAFPWLTRVKRRLRSLATRRV